jgi:glutamate/aspartate transport system ATP-binding protein
MPQTPMIVLDKVCKSYGASLVLRDCTTAIGRGEVVVICGPSGSGKSTLIKCINGLEPYQSGSIRVDGIEVGARTTDLPKLRARIGMVFQHFELYPHMSALDNIVLAQVHALKRKRDEAQARARTLLARVGLAEKADARPADLSGGQQQRVAIARALALEPEMMLFDEPTSALDPELVGSVLAVMRDLRASGMTMLVVSHEMRFAREAADRIVFMDHGAILEQGPPEQLFTAASHERTRAFMAEVVR